MIHRSFSCRRFLAAAGGIAAGALVTGCSGSSYQSQARRVAPSSPQVLRVEKARRTAGQGITQVSRTAVHGDLDLGGRVVRTWSYDGGPADY